jgi:hypothetical protein
MPDEVRASPTELGRAAQLALTESQSLFTGLRLARGGMSLDEESIGNTAMAAEIATAHTEVSETAGTAVERLISVLEQDVDALYQIAFAYQRGDQ